MSISVVCFSYIKNLSDKFVADNFVCDTLTLYFCLELLLNQSADLKLYFPFISDSTDSASFTMPVPPIFAFRFFYHI